ncbi:hypothetical protein [Clostridium tagluense]|uniref:Uncharacterized protein n=1 Tax=Clostridium tagluense TaxID=360422 RepID=A0A401UPE8_9CLOT|nr:hypothetical protein [Clostridium tagluense]GCD11404.1 hypothetical protein Ctaglu_30270 [Clostridium tagluense]
MDNNIKFLEVRSKYFAQGLSFLGFRYMKFGFGVDTIYGFEDTQILRTAMTKMISLKNSLNLD